MVCAETIFYLAREFYYFAKYINGQTSCVILKARELNEISLASSPTCT